MKLSNVSVVRFAKSTPLLAARQHIQTQAILSQARLIQQIPAPTFHEKERAEYVQSRFNDLGLKGVFMDDLYNVYAWLDDPQPDAPLLLVAAHTDTVFPLETDLTCQERPLQVQGAGLGDNSLGVAGLLLLAELFVSQALPRQTNICFVANSREEGLGDLGGIKAVREYLGKNLYAAIIIEGMALGRIYNAGIAVRRYQIKVKGSGGHSWLHFGASSAIHQLSHFVSAFTLLQVPPRTAYNVGLIQGGSSINTIAAEASCYLDLRSEDEASLAELEKQMYHYAENYLSQGLQYEVFQVGNRPAGRISADHPLVRLAQAACAEINRVGELEAGSTDANALLAHQIPCVCVGITYGGHAHTSDEYIELAPLADGMWQILLLTVAASHLFEG